MNPETAVDTTRKQALQDKVCLVTGGTRGIGFAIARMLLDEGAKVAVCGRTSHSVERAVALLRETTHHPDKVKGKAADVEVYEQVAALFEFIDREFGGQSGAPSGNLSTPFDILVNNAGIGAFAKVSELSVENWHATLGTNLTGAFYCSKEALARFSIRNRGYIVNISSLAGKNAFAGGAAYNASKFGLNGFSEALMLDARYDGIRVSTVAPGSVATEFGGHSEMGKDWRVWPEDVAEIVRMLLLMPERTMVSYVEVRPAKPPRK